MDFSGRRSGTVSGWDDHSIANVQEPAEVDKTKDKMATAG